jgi:hypothetical protein
MFSDYCKSEPKIKKSKLNNKLHYSIWFDTSTLEVFNFLHESFYSTVKGKIIKTVPSNIENLLTSRGLAYWYMDDGTADRSGFIIYANNFKLSEVKILIQVLNSKFNLDCTIQSRLSKSTNLRQFYIYIKSNSADKFVNLIKPFIVATMEYKLKLRGSFKSD